MSLERYLKGKRILLLGLGREGLCSLEVLRDIDVAYLGLADRNPASVERAKESIPDGPLRRGRVGLYSGEEYLQALDDDYEIILKSPGISLRDEPRMPEVMQRLRRCPGTEITGQADLFLRFTHSRVAAVSGTKGKSTTTSLLYGMLRRSHEAYLRGNIGVPPLQDYRNVEGGLCALELSCHQLEFTRHSPQIAVLTNLFPEHLDHYKDYEHYIESKLNLIAYPPSTGMLLVTTAEDPFVVEKVLAKLGPRHRVSWLSRRPEDLDRLRSRLSASGHEEQTRGRHTMWLLQENTLSGPDGSVLRLPAGPGLGASHLLFDAALAAIAAEAMGISAKDVREACATFQGLPHRCEPLGIFAGRRFYNDSIATIPHAAILAVEALPNVSTLIVGGMDRGIDYDELIRELPKTGVTKLVTLPDTGPAIASAFRNTHAGRFEIREVRTMREAVRAAYELSAVGETVLFSPAAASYHAYRDFAERGDDYRAEVRMQAGDFGKRGSTREERL